MISHIQQSGRFSEATSGLGSEKVVGLSYAYLALNFISYALRLMLRWLNGECQRVFLSCFLEVLLAASFPCFSGQLHESIILLNYSFSEHLLYINYIPAILLMFRGTEYQWCSVVGLEFLKYNDEQNAISAFRCSQ